jgi:HSP20 family protein
MAEPASKLTVRNETGAPRLSFNNLRHEIDRLFDDFDGWPHGAFRSLLGPSFAPAVDLAERKDAFEITAEIPGLEEKDIEVKLSNGGLSIRGEKKSEREEKRQNYYLSERSYGAFDRHFSLPDGVDTDKIAATFKDGVLTVTLPKTAQAQRSEKNIPVKGA